MPEDIDVTRVRAALDLAICRLFEDAQLLEGAGLESEAQDAYACAQSLKATRSQVIRGCHSRQK